MRRPSVISVFVLVALWNISIATDWPAGYLEEEGFWRDTIGGLHDINLHLQLRFYQVLTRHRPDPFQPDHVSLVYIDDDTHWTTLFGDQPTNRAFLARVVRNAANPETKADVIGLDVELLSPRNFPEGSDAGYRDKDNDALLGAVQYASSKGVPVILGSVYAVEDGRRIDLPNIFTLADLLASPHLDCARVSCPGFGYLNLPEDKREIPLITKIPPADPHLAPYLDSFALAVARAYRGPIEAAKYPILNPRDHPDNAPVFGTFLPETETKNRRGLQSTEKEFPQISITGLANGDLPAMQACAKRIVLIGGHWHERQGYLGWVDQHLSPAGYISGLALHANYIESLLQHKFTHELNIWINVALDLFIGLIIYLCFEAASTGWRIAVLFIVFFVPLIAAWLFLGLANIYLDFLLPIELYFLHLLYEVVEKHFCLKRHKTSQNAVTSGHDSLPAAGGKP